MSPAGKIFKWLKPAFGIFLMLFSGFELVEAVVQEEMNWGWSMGSPTWTLADHPVHYIGELAARALVFGYGLWLVFGPWDGGKSQRSESD
jgi:hypothetical protein